MKKREELFLKLRIELVPHMKAEESAFYPPLMAKKEAREDVLEGRRLDSRETGLREPASATSNARKAKPLPKPNPKRRRRPNRERGS